MCLLTKTEREGKREEKEREGVNENFWFKKCDILENCQENRYTGTGTGLQNFKPVPVLQYRYRYMVQKSGPVPCLT